MADTQKSTKTDKLSDIIKSIIPHIPADMMAALLNHPHANDVIDAAGQAAAKAARIDTIASPNNSSQDNTALSTSDAAAAVTMSDQDTARLKAISDMAVAAQQQRQRQSQQQETDPQGRGDAPKDDFVTSMKGIGKLMGDLIVNSYNQAVKGK